MIQGHKDSGLITDMDDEDKKGPQEVCKDASVSSLGKSHARQDDDNLPYVPTPGVNGLPLEAWTIG